VATGGGDDNESEGAIGAGDAIDAADAIAAGDAIEDDGAEFEEGGAAVGFIIWRTSLAEPSTRRKTDFVGYYHRQNLSYRMLRFIVFASHASTVRLS
jgi:hypothetical protein